MVAKALALLDDDAFLGVGGLAGQANDVKAQEVYSFTSYTTRRAGLAESSCVSVVARIAGLTLLSVCPVVEHAGLAVCDRRGTGN